MTLCSVILYHKVVFLNCKETHDSLVPALTAQRVTLSLSGATLYVEERNNGVFLDATVKNPLTAKLRAKCNI